MPQSVPNEVLATLQDPPLRATITSATLDARTVQLTLECEGTSVLELAERITHHGPVTVTRGDSPTTYTVELCVPDTEQRHPHPVRLPLELAQLAKAARARTGTAAGEQVLNALAQHNTNLRTQHTHTRALLGLEPGAPQRRRGIGPTAQLWLNLTAAELHLLDTASRDWCSGNRSHLATLLLTAELTTKPPLSRESGKGGRAQRTSD